MGGIAASVARDAPANRPSVSPIPEETLMVAYARGDRHAFSELFARLAGRVFDFFERSFDDASAEDLVRLTFVKVHIARRRYDPERPLRLWVFTIAAGVRRDELRRRYGLPARASEGEIARTGTPVPAPIDRVDSESDPVETVRAAIRRLPEVQRVVIHLHRGEKMSFADIASILGTESAAVRMRACEAYRNLKVSGPRRGSEYGASMGHFADRAPFIAALSANDLERVEALLHAAGCEACRLALREGTRLLSHIVTLAPSPALSHGRLARLASAVQREVDKENEAARRFRTLALGVSVGAAWGVVLVTAQHRADSVSAWLASAALALAALAAVAFARGRRAWAMLIAAGVSATVAVWAGQTSGLDVHAGIACTLRELLAALLPLGTAYWAAHREGVWNAAIAATAAVAGAIAGQAALQLACPAAAHETHRLVFHTGGVLLAGLLAAVSSPFLHRSESRE
jgi:RNA polymerase sigma-70 factor (ECF subfamily)